MELHERLVELRQSRGLTQISFAEVLGVKRARYNAWEQSLSEPDVQFLNKIADFYHVSIDYLIGRTDMPNAEMDRLESLETNFRIIQRVAMNLSKEERRKALDLWIFIFEEKVKQATIEEDTTDKVKKENEK